MNTRPAFPPKGWWLFAATCLLLIGPAILLAQTRGSSSPQQTTSKPRHTRPEEPLSLRPISEPIISAFQRELEKIKAETKLKPATGTSGAAAPTDDRAAESAESTGGAQPRKRPPGLLPFFRSSRAELAASAKRTSTVKPAIRQVRPTRTTQTERNGRPSSTSRPSRGRGLPIADLNDNEQFKSSLESLKQLILSNKFKSGPKPEQTAPQKRAALPRQTDSRQSIASRKPAASRKMKTQDSEVQLAAGRRQSRPQIEKPSLLDRLLGRDARPTARRRPQQQPLLPPAPAPLKDPSEALKKIPGLLPSFLTPQSVRPRQSQTSEKNARTANRTTTAKTNGTPSPAAAETTKEAPMRTSGPETSFTRLRELDNPFPEVSEAAADKQQENPFTGTKLEKLDTEPAIQPTTSVRPIVQEQPTESQDSTAPLTSAELESSGHQPETEAQEDETPFAKTAPPFPPVAEVAETEAELDKPVIAAGQPPKQDNADSLEEKMKRLSERSEMSGLKGFCPVALRNRRSLVDADPRISSTYKEKTFHLSSSDAKSTFDAEPAKYAPIHGGNDVIVLTQGNVELEGSLENAAWYKDRLYLFSSSETLELFVQDPAKYAATAADQ